FRPMGLSGRGRGLPRRPSLSARMRGARGRIARSPDDAQSLRGAEPDDLRSHRRHAPVAGFREAEIAAVQISTQRRIPGRAAQDRHRQGRSSGTAGLPAMKASFDPRTAVIATVLAGLALLPVYSAFGGNQFLLILFTRIVIFAIAATSLNLILGYGGMM